KEIVTGKEEEHRRGSIEEFLAKLQRKKRKLKGEAEERFQTAAGMGITELAQLLRNSPVGVTAQYLSNHPALAPFLDRAAGTGSYKMVVSERVDEVRDVTRGYGKHGSRRPGDYLDAFRQFVENNSNRLPALLVVMQRPKELTREDLRQLKLALDEE